MNLEESDLFKEQLEKNTSRKKTIIVALVVCVVMIIVMIALIVYISYVDKHTNKLFIDKTVTKKVDYHTISKDVVYDKLIGDYGWEEENLPELMDDPIFINVKALAEALGYNCRPGEYKRFDEDTNSITLESRFEIVSFTAGGEYYQKYLNSSAIDSKAAIGPFTGLQFANNVENYVENYRFSCPPIVDDSGAIYINIEDIDKMFNAQKNWNGEYWKYITSLNSLAKSVKLGDAVANVSGYYENIRAIADGYVVVGDGPANNQKTRYGVYKLTSTSGEPFISMQYANIIYQQNTEQFYIYDAEKKVGLAYDDKSNTAKVIIKPGDYTDIELIDDKLNLYKVEATDEYGVVQKSDELKTIVNPEFSEIGYDYKEEFPSYDIGSQYVWCDKFIPVQKGGKLGLYKVGDTEKGSLQALPVSFDGFGYISKEKNESGNEESLLVIPPETGIFGIVILRNERYGIFDLNSEKVVVPCNCKKFYSKTQNGITTYYCLPDDGSEIELSNYFSNVDGSGKSIKNVDSNGKYTGEKKETTSGDEAEFDPEEFYKEITSYEGKEVHGTKVKILLNNLIKNAHDNAKDIDLIPSVEYYSTYYDSELIEPSFDENEQETYISDLSSIVDEITRQDVFDVTCDKATTNDMVTKVTIKRVENETSTTTEDGEEEE